MRKFIIAAAALAALSATPALAQGEGTFQPTVTAAGFGPVRGPAAAVANSFQYNNAGNYGDTFSAPAARATALFGGRLSAGSFVYSMANGNG